MGRFCPVSGRKRLVGNRVSHANNKTKRVFELNLKPFSFFSELLGNVRLKLSVKGMRTVEKAGGIDAYLALPSGKLNPALLPMKRSFDKLVKRKSA